MINYCRISEANTTTSSHGNSWDRKFHPYNFSQQGLFECLLYVTRESIATTYEYWELFYSEKGEKDLYLQLPLSYSALTPAVDCKVHAHA